MSICPRSCSKWPTRMWNGGRSIVTRSGTAISIKGVTSVSRWKQKTTSTRSFATWSGTPCVQTSVERAESWRWSSLRRVEREDPAFPILSTWPLPRPTDWLQIVNQPQTEAEVAALRCCVNRGRPFGDPNWVTDTAKRLGLESTIRPRGRPKKQSEAGHGYWWLSRMALGLGLTSYVLMTYVPL